MALTFWRTQRERQVRDIERIQLSEGHSLPEEHRERGDGDGENQSEMATRA
jgi:hypothetical protein